MRFSLVSDHFPYLASIGILLGVAGVMTRLTGKNLPVFAVLLLLALGHLTWKQIPVYKNDYNLWSDTIQKNPNAWMAQYNLGNVFIAEQKIEKAMHHYRKALRIKPDFPRALYNLGNALLTQEKTGEAIIQYQAVIRIKPGFVDVYNNWGVALLMEGKTQEAITRFQKALELKPDFADARNNLKIARSTSAGKLQ